MQMLSKFWVWNVSFIGIKYSPTSKRKDEVPPVCFRNPRKEIFCLNGYELKQEQKECAEIALSGTNTRRNLLLDSFDL